jgi:hypothetical protein
MSNKVPEAEIRLVMDESDFICETKFGKCTVVTMRLPNGYVLVESSGCVSPEDYDEALGVDLCKQALERKVWQLYGFLQQEKHPIAREE